MSTTSLSIATETPQTCATNLSGSLQNANPACAIDASAASLPALEHCCGGGKIQTQQNNCILFCEPQGVTLNAVNQCLYLYLSQHAPGYQGGIHCNRDGAQFTTSVAPGASSTGKSTASNNAASRGNAWVGLIVAWVGLCAVGGGIGAVV